MSNITKAELEAIIVKERMVNNNLTKTNNELVQKVEHLGREIKHARSVSDKVDLLYENKINHLKNVMSSYKAVKFPPVHNPFGTTPDNVNISEEELFINYLQGIVQ